MSLGNDDTAAFWSVWLRHYGCGFTGRRDYLLGLPLPPGCVAAALGVRHVGCGGAGDVFLSQAATSHVAARTAPVNIG